MREILWLQCRGECVGGGGEGEGGPGIRKLACQLQYQLGGVSGWGSVGVLCCVCCAEVCDRGCQGVCGVSMEGVEAEG